MTTEQIYMALGFGSGINHMPTAELRALWERHGEAVTAYWLKRHGAHPFVAEIAKREGWTSGGKAKA